MADRHSTAGAETMSPGHPNRIRSKAEIRQRKPDRDAFMALPRRPITVVVDGVRRNHDLGAIFRLCDGFLADRLVICGSKVDLRKPKLVRAAAGTQDWVPWERADSAVEVLAAAKAGGAWIIVAEPTTTSCSPEKLTPAFPAWLVLGSDKHGLSQPVVDLADATVSIPMAGMANALNLAGTAAILLHWLTAAYRGPGSLPDRPTG